MNFDIPAALAATPERLAALLRGEPDADIDAEVQLAEEETGLHKGLTGAELAEQRFYYRIDLFALSLTRLVDQGYVASGAYGAAQEALEAA